MGGYGSGRQGGYPTDGATNSVVIDMADLKDLREGMHGAGTLSYRCALRGEEAMIRLELDMRREGDWQAVFSHVTRDRHSEPITYMVDIVPTLQPLGGRRWWFVCPYLNVRARKLYLPLGGREFRCRDGYRLGYASQREDAMGRGHLRLARICRKLGTKYRGLLDGPPPRPKGMRRRTYKRLLGEWWEGYARIDSAFVAGASRLLARLPKRTGLPVALVALAMLSGTDARAETLRCEIAEKHVCEAGTGCRAIPPKVWNLVDMGERTFSRCDSSGCDTYPAHFSKSGIFVIIDAPGRGLVAKVSDGGAFVESATLGTSAYVSFGACRRVP